MKISRTEVRAALDAYAKSDGDRAERPDAPRPPEGEAVVVDRLQREIDAMPDERALLVRSLRTKLRHGNYHVPSLEIVRALLGRLAVDRPR
jgi:hypothetical protein